MSVEVIDKIKPKNGGNFKIIDSVDIEMPDGSSLQEVIKYLTDNVEDITQGKFDPSKYYNMEEIIAKYYDKQEVNELLALLESQLDAEQIEENITNKVNSLFPLGLDLIDHDFNIYLQKENLIEEVKKILDGYNLDIESDIDIEKLNEMFYNKEETMNKEEIRALFNSINKELISNWVSSGYFNKQEVQNLLDGKLSADFGPTISKLVSEFDIHKKESADEFDKLRTDLSNQIVDGLLTKANSSTVDSLVANFEGFINDTFTSTIQNLCNEEDVRNIITDEVQNGDLRQEINNAVVDSTFIINDRINTIKNDLERYVFKSDFYDEIKKIKAEMAVLGADSYNQEYMEVINSINKRIEEIEKILDEKKIEEHLSDVIKNLTQLEEEYISLNKIMSEHTDRIENLETDFTGLTDSVSLLSDAVGFNGESINNISEELETTLKAFNSVKEEFEDLKGRISDTGFNELEYQVEQAQIGINTLNAEPEIGEDGLITYPEGSVYDKIFNSDNMTYDVELPDGPVKMVFKASDFINDVKNINTNINALNGRISDVSTTVENNSYRLNVTQGEVFDIKSDINEIENNLGRIDEFGQNIADFSGIMSGLEEKVNSLDEVTAKSIITKINNTDETVLINSNALNLRGSINYNSLSGDLTSLLNKTSSGIFLNGAMITPNTISAKSLNLKGVTVNSIIKDNGMTINKYNTFSISDSGDVSIVNPSIISTDFNSTDISGYQLLPDGKAIFNNAEIRGKFLLPNAGLYGIKDNDDIDSVRIWAGSIEENRNEAPFRVQQDGFLFASNAAIGGTVVATSLHNGAIHMEGDEIKVNNNFVLLNNKNNIDEYLAGDEEKEFICLNSRESVLNTNVKFGDSLKYDINHKTLDLNGKLNIRNDNTEILFNEKGIRLENPISKHEIYQNKDNGTMMFESGNNSSINSPDFMFTSRNSVRDCNVKIKGSLEVTEEIKSNKNNVVLRSTENGFAFFSI